MLKLLASNDQALRHQACQILKDIGTKKSIPALEKAAKDGDALVKILADQALSAIRRRQ